MQSMVATLPPSGSFVANTHKHLMGEKERDSRCSVVTTGEGGRQVSGHVQGTFVVTILNAEMEKARN